MRRAFVAAFFLTYVVVMGASPALRWWSPSRVIVGWQMFSSRPRELLTTIRIHYTGGGTEDLLIRPEYRRTVLMSGAAPVAVVNYGVDGERFAPPHLCSALAGAAMVTGTTSVGREIRFTCPR